MGSEREQTVTSGGDILAASFDQIHTAFNSLRQDRERYKHAYNTVLVNAIKGNEPEKLLDFLANEFSLVGTGCTIAEAMKAWEDRCGDHLTTERTDNG